MQITISDYQIYMIVELDVMILQLDQKDLTSRSHDLDVQILMI